MISNISDEVNQPMANISINKKPSSNELLPEIWARVIFFLRRPMGSTSNIGRPNDYHQRDLATAMRVNKMFYRFASTVLYERVIISNFPLFFYGIPKLSPDSPPEVFDNPKIRLFRYIKRLDIAYTSLGSDQHTGSPLPPQMLDMLNLPSSIVPALTSDINQTYEVINDPLMGWAKSPSAPLLFPNLEIITTGGFGERQWDHYNPNFTKLDQINIFEIELTEEYDEYSQILHHTSKQCLFGRFLSGCSKPKHICNYVSSGPMTPIWNRHFPNDEMLKTRATTMGEYHLPETYTTHLLEQIHTGVWLHIAEGTINRWIIDPIFKDCNPDIQMLVYTYLLGQLTTRRQLSGILNMDKATKLEIYGAKDPQMIRNVIPILVDRHEEILNSGYTDQIGLEAMISLLGLGEEDEKINADVVFMDSDGSLCQACDDIKYL